MHTVDDPESLLLDVTCRDHPCKLDRVLWSLPMRAGKPAANWLDFVTLYERGAACTEAHPWLSLWKRRMDRTLELDANGRDGFDEQLLDTLVVPPWEHACFAGRPEFEIHLRLKGNTCGTVWLSSSEPRTLIQEARWCEGMSGQHWFDWLHFSFMPSNPRYGVVDSANKLELRVIGQ
jgi:hypothetical protein